MGSLRAIAVWATLGLVSCGTLPLSPDDRERLDRAEARWAEAGYTDYTIEVVHYCSCPPSLHDRARIEVVDGTIRRVTLLSTLAIITDERLQHYRTVTDLFQDIRSASSQEAWERVTFSVDPVLGYPTYIHWAAKPAASELELTMVISNLKLLTSAPAPR